MQLSFLGQTYTLSTPDTNATATDETAMFMGRPYTRKQYQPEPPQSSPEDSPEELTFMGQRYVRAADTESQPLPCKPRPGERRVDHRQLIQLQRSRTVGRRHPAFRGS